MYEEFYKEKVYKWKIEKIFNNNININVNIKVNLKVKFKNKININLNWIKILN